MSFKEFFHFSKEEPENEVELKENINSPRQSELVKNLEAFNYKALDKMRVEGGLAQEEFIKELGQALRTVYERDNKAVLMNKTIKDFAISCGIDHRLLAFFEGELEQTRSKAA